MESAVKKLKFEEAAKIRDRILSVYNLYLGQTQTSELIELKKALNLSVLPLTIEAIDISSLSGKQASGSVVVFKGGLPDKSSYRKFKIKTVPAADDYAMIAEVLVRRYRRLFLEKLDSKDLYRYKPSPNNLFPRHDPHH